MDELAELARVRADVAPPSARVLATARAQVLEREHRTTDLVPRWRRPLRRRALIGVAATIALGAGAFALTNDGPHSSGGGSAPRAGAPAPVNPSAATSVPPASVSPAAPTSTTAAGPAPHFADAAAILDATAARTLRAGDPTLGPGQYAYTRVRSLYVTQVDDPPAQGAYEFYENTDEGWQPASIDGLAYERGDHYISVRFPTAAQRRYVEAAPGGVPARTVEWDVTKGASDPVQVFPPLALPQSFGCAQTDGTVTSQCPAAGLSPWEGSTRAALAELPTDPTALRASLFAFARAQNADATTYGKSTRVNSIALKQIGAVLDTTLADAKLQAALFDVAKTIPGVRLVGSMANYDGTRGLAIGLVDTWGVRTNLIFDARGRGYLGERIVLTRPTRQYELKGGTVVSWTAVTTRVTGKPVLPPGSSIPH